MKIADDTFLGNSECEWVNGKPEIGKDIIFPNSVPVDKLN